MWLLSLALLSLPVAPGPQTRGEVQPEPRLPVPPLSTARIASAFFEDGGGLARVGTRIGAAIPVVDRPDQIVLPRAGYSFERLNADSGDLRLNDLDLHRFELGVQTTLALSSEWSFSADFRLIVAGDLERHGSQLWQPFVRANAVFSPNENTSFYVGALLIRTRLGLVPLPSLGLAWRNQAWSIRLIPPRRLEVSYQAHRTVELYVVGTFDEEAWLVDNAKLPGIGDLGGEEALLLRSRVRAGIGARLDVPGGFAIELEGSVAPWRQVSIQSSRFEEAPAFDFQPGIGATLALSRRL